MTRRTRRQRDLPFTLFSFQDIMASVTGVVILITLMLMLELIARPLTQAVAASPRVDDPRAIEARLEALRAQLMDASSTAPDKLAAAERAAGALEDLLTVLEKRLSSTAERADQAEQVAAEKRRELEALLQRTSELQRQTEIERSQTRITLQEEDVGGKRTWFVECGAGDLRVGRIENGEATRFERGFKGDGAADDLLKWALAQPLGQERFVLLVRPDGVGMFNRVQQVLRGAGADVGWDLWTSSIRVFPEPLESR